MPFPNCLDCGHFLRARRPLEDVPAEATIQFVDDDELVCGPCIKDVRFGRPKVGIGGLVFDASGQVVKRFPSTVTVRSAPVAFFDSTTGNEMDADDALDALLDLMGDN